MTFLVNLSLHDVKHSGMNAMVYFHCMVFCKETHANVRFWNICLDFNESLGYEINIERFVACVLNR